MFIFRRYWNVILAQVSGLIKSMPLLVCTQPVRRIFFISTRQTSRLVTKSGKSGAGSEPKHSRRFKKVQWRRSFCFLSFSLSHTTSLCFAFSFKVWPLSRCVPLHRRGLLYLMSSSFRNWKTKPRIGTREPPKIIISNLHTLVEALLHLVMVSKRLLSALYLKTSWVWLPWFQLPSSSPRFSQSASSVELLGVPMSSQTQTQNTHPIILNTVYTI